MSDGRTTDHPQVKGSWKYGAGVLACLALAWFPFVRDTRVPLLGGVDLGFHELGHMLTYWLPDTATAMMGSITQVAVPLGLAAYFGLWRKEYLGAGLCLAWAGTSAHDVSIYIADAPYQALALIGGEHDWAFLLGGSLDSAAGIARTVNGAGMLMVVAGTAVCAAGPWLESRRQAAEPASAPAATAPSGGWAIGAVWEEDASQADPTRTGGDG